MATETIWRCACRLEMVRAWLLDFTEAALGDDDMSLLLPLAAEH